MGVWIWHWNQNASVSIEAFRRAETEKNTSSSVKCENFAHYFLRLQWHGASSILPQDRTVNVQYCLEVMHRLRESIHQKRTELWKNISWIMHRDNAPAHTSMLVREFLAKNKTLIMPQPSYSTDLSVFDVFLFPELKKSMKGKRFDTIEELLVILKGVFQKFGQMGRFCFLFSTIAMVWCIMNSCLNIIRSPWSYAPIARKNSNQKHRIVEKPIMDFALW